MEKLPKVISRSDSPVKSARKGEQKVQFSDETDLRLRGQKVIGKPPEVPRAPPYGRSSSRLSGSSSMSSSNSSSSSCSSSCRLSSGGGSCSALDRASQRGGDSSRWTTSLDRKRAGSVRGKPSDRPPRSDSSRSLSLDRRRAENSRRESASPSSSSSERRRRDCEAKDSHKEKRPKIRTVGTSHNRSFSGERTKLPGRQKMPAPTLSHSGKSDHSKMDHILEQRRSLQNEDKNKQVTRQSEKSDRTKRTTSRSPHRSQMNGEGVAQEDKENEKIRDKGSGDSKSQEKKERGRSLKRESRKNKQ